MSKITFSKSKSQKNTVNNLLNTILPGYSVTTSSSSISKPSKQSTTEIISKFNKRLSPEEIHRINKQQKSQIKKITKAERKSKTALEKKVKLDLIKQNRSKLTKDESRQYKALLSKQISSILNLVPDKEETEEIQRDIMDVVNPTYKRKKGKKVQEKTVLYKKKGPVQHNFQGLTPGLAPVDMEDSDSDED